MTGEIIPFMENGADAAEEPRLGAVLGWAERFGGGRKPRPRMCVYLMRDGMTTTFKVGISDHPIRRLRELKNAGGRHNLALVREVWLSSADASKLEVDMHRALIGYRTAGEWFIAPATAIFDVFDGEVEALRESGVLEPIELPPIPEGRKAMRERIRDAVASA